MRFSICLPLLVLPFLVLGAPYFATAGFAAGAGEMKLAQSQGGSLSGGSLGGSIDSAPAARPKRAAAAVQAPARRTQPESPRSRGGGASLSSYDGAWSVTSTGCSGAGTGQVTISNGRVITQTGAVTGRVSPQGVVNTASSFNGVTFTGTGQIRGQSAYGSFHQSDGCTGSWRAIKL